MEREHAIEVSTTIRTALARAREVLADDPGLVLSDAPTAEERRTRRFVIDLQVDLGAGTSVHQTAAVKLGRVRENESGIVFDIEWDSTGHEHLFPHFAGHVAASAHPSGTRLRVGGVYTVPLGTLGRFGDALAGRRLARRSLEVLVEHMARRLDEEVVRRLETSHRGARGEPDHSEVYLG
jgi:hypothetical protein